jgi:hypothetical protein
MNIAISVPETVQSFASEQKISLSDFFASIGEALVVSSDFSGSDLLAITKGLKDIKAGRTIDFEDYFASV